MREVVLHGRSVCQRRTAPRRRPDSLPPTRTQRATLDGARDTEGGPQRSGRAASDRSSIDFPRSPSRRLTCPRTCSHSSITTSSTLAAPTATPEAGDRIQYDELRIEHDRGDVEIVVYRSVLSAPQ